MGEIKEKLDAYTEELLLDLEMVNLSEEQQAEIYSRLEERLRDAILAELNQVLDEAEKKNLAHAFDAQNYTEVEQVLGGYPDKKKTLEKRIEKEFNSLKDTIIEEQKHV